MSTTTPDPQGQPERISDDDIRRDAGEILRAPTSAAARQVTQNTLRWSSMARIKPQDRQAESDTDVAIAMHVMGWTWQPDGYGVMAWFDHYANETGYGAGGEWHPFRPSTNIAHAWRVLEHFAWPQFYTRMIRTDNGNWRCDIELNGGDGPNRSAWAETAPLAICRAALAAVGV